MNEKKEKEEKKKMPVEAATEDEMTSESKKVAGEAATKVEGAGWRTLLLSKIKSVPAAVEKWEMLTNSTKNEHLDDKDQEAMAEYLFRFCGGTREQLRIGLTRARRFRVNFPKAIAQIRATADTAEEMLKDLREIGGVSIPDLETLPLLLRSFADELDELGFVMKETIAPGAKVAKKDGVIGGARDRDGNIVGGVRVKRGDVIGGRSDALVTVVHIVERVTKDPYISIAPLVAAVRGDDEPAYEYIADNLRRIYNQYRISIRKAKPRGCGPRSTDKI